MIPVDRVVCQMRDQWLVVGKGPTYSRLAGREWCNNVMFLNNSPLPAAGIGFKYHKERSFVHLVDLEVVEEFGDELEDAVEYFVMPWMPNYGFNRGSRNLQDLVSKVSLLHFLEGQDRLLFYNRKGSANVHPLYEGAVEVRYFSVEGALGVLARCGMGDVMLSGIDGGREYAEEFSGQVPLMNGRKSFDDQFRQLKGISKKYGMHFNDFCETTDAFEQPLDEQPDERLELPPDDEVEEVALESDFSDEPEGSQ